MLYRQVHTHRSHQYSRRSGNRAHPRSHCGDATTKNKDTNINRGTNHRIHSFSDTGLLGLSIRRRRLTQYWYLLHHLTSSARLPLTCTIRSVQPVTILVRCLCYPGRALKSQHQDILRRLYVRALSIDHRLCLCVRPHIYRFIVHRQWTIHLRGPL